MYKIWDKIYVNNKEYYFQFYARYNGKDNIIVCEYPKNTKDYNKYYCLEDLEKK